MPTYQYTCTECANDLEAVQKFTDDPLVECPQCSGKLRKVFSAVGVVFKGSGFYRTDSRAKSSSSASEKSSASSSESKSKSTAKEPSVAASSAGSSSGNGSSGNGSSGNGSSGSGASGKKRESAA